MVLAVFSIFFGYLTKDIFIGIATGFFMDNSIFIHPNHEIMLETEFSLPFYIKILPLTITLFTICFFNGYTKLFFFLFIYTFTVSIFEKIFFISFLIFLSIFV